MQKRLFFGFDLLCPWPETFPKGRIVEEKNRHLTLAFLGSTEVSAVLQALSSLPLIPFPLAALGIFEDCLFLPEKEPKVAAWKIAWQTYSYEIETFQNLFCDSLLEKDILQKKDDRPFLSHVSIARSPEEMEEWKSSFEKRPVSLNAFHLFESLGHSKYQSLWSHPLIPSFEEFEHTADMAFKIRGENLQQIHQSAQFALAFHYPHILDFFKEIPEQESLEEVIHELNSLVMRADAQIGCPFKAVSFHGELEKKESWLEWEMVIDV